MAKRRQKRARVDVNPKQPIDVDEQKAAGTGPEELWLPELGLRRSDKQTLVSPMAWLSDDIINAAQRLLQKANPNMSGFQDVACGLTMNFDVESGEFVQILYTGQGHWNTISNVGKKHADIQIFDSAYTFASTTIKNQVASLLCTSEEFMKLTFVDVQMQSGSSDCGLFSIAFATALAFGEQCFESGKMSMFPFKKIRRQSTKVKAVMDVPLYCSCRMPEMPDIGMIMCSQCRAWFHIDTCVTIPQQAMKRGERWLCTYCV